MKSILLSLSLLYALSLSGQKTDSIPVAKAWANNSVNAVVFRKNSIVTWKQIQFVAFYNAEQYLVIGKRSLQSQKWELKTSKYKGHATDAHNSISIMVDGKGYLHVAWDHHNSPLNYCKSIAPGSIILGEKQSMTQHNEQHLTYPEFYKMPSGNLFFIYRDGESGRGNCVINRYDVQTGSWQQVQQKLIDGEGQRNAYWQAAIDDKGYFHLSWVWRESGDVASNHDLCYAVSKDEGATWEKSTGEKYNIPITAGTAEYAAFIIQKSELINQTSMCVLENIPVIASYWREPGSLIPQYHIVYLDKGTWKQQLPFLRNSAFSLSGTGTKKIPIARPQILGWKKNHQSMLAMLFRDEERGSKVSMAINKDFPDAPWMVKDLTQSGVGSWEPSYDTELWRLKKQLALFVQNVVQVDGEGKADLPAQLIFLLLVSFN